MGDDDDADDDVVLSTKKSIKARKPDQKIKKIEVNKNFPTY